MAKARQLYDPAQVRKALRKRFGDLLRGLTVGEEGCLHLFNRGMFGRQAKVQACFDGNVYILSAMVGKKRWNAFMKCYSHGIC